LDRNLLKISIQGSFARRTPNLEGSNRHFTQSRLQVKGCTAERYCLLHFLVQGPESFRGCGQLFIRRTVAELQGIKVAQFSDFGLFSPYKTPKNVTFGDQPTAQGLHHRMIPIFLCDSRRSKGVPSSNGVFLRLLVGELWTPYLLLVFGVSFHSVLRPLESLAQCTSPLQPKVTKTSLWLLRTAKE